MIKNEFDYVLLTPLEKVGVGGSFVTVDRLFLRAPSKKLGQYTAKLKQGIKQSENFIQNQILSSVKDINSFLEKIQPAHNQALDESDEKKSEKFINQIMSSNVNWHDFEESFKQLCINGCCSINEQTPMTAALFDRLSDKDGDNMLGLYLANFFS